PPVDIGAETEAATPVVLVDADLQADVALLHQVKEVEPAVEVPACDRDNQAEVGLDEVPPSALTVFGEQLQPFALGLGQRLRFGREEARGGFAADLHALR